MLYIEQGMKNQEAMELISVLVKFQGWYVRGRYNRLFPCLHSGTCASALMVNGGFCWNEFWETVCLIKFNDFETAFQFCDIIAV